MYRVPLLTAQPALRREANIRCVVTVTRQAHRAGCPPGSVLWERQGRGVGWADGPSEGAGCSMGSSPLGLFISIPALPLPCAKGNGKVRTD